MGEDHLRRTRYSSLADTGTETQSTVSASTGKENAELITPVQFSPLTDWVGGGGVRNDSAEILFQSFCAGGPCEQFRHNQGCPLFDVVHPASPLPTVAHTQCIVFGLAYSTKVEPRERHVIYGTRFHWLSVALCLTKVAHAAFPTDKTLSNGDVKSCQLP